MERLLPVGSVVRLNRVDNREFMIMGYFQKMEEEIYEYIAVLYPNGLVASDSCFLFNGSDVDKVVYEGYMDEECKAFTEAVPKVIGLANEAMEQIK